VADFANNSHKVDGKHAVGAGASKQARAGKLVATDNQGFLPKDIVRRYKNVVVVAKKGGDFKKIQAAVDSIDDSGPNKRYLVWVAPGIYNEDVDMESFIDLRGAGRALTTIRCECGTQLNSDSQDGGSPVRAVPGSTVSSMTLINTGGNDHSHGVDIDGSFAQDGIAVLEDLKIEARGASDTAIGVFNTVGVSRIENVEITVSGTGSDHIGIAGFGEMILEDVKVDAVGGVVAAGVRAQSGLTTIQNSSIAARGGTSENFGIDSLEAKTTVEETYVSVSGPPGAASYGVHTEVFGTNPSDAFMRLTDVRIDAIGTSTFYYGVYNDETDLFLSDVSIRSSGGTSNHGVFNNAPDSDGNKVQIDHSRITQVGTGVTVRGITGFTINIGATLLEGGNVSAGGATVTCAGTYNEAYVFAAGPACA
jgi:hypothetical protein